MEDREYYHERAEAELRMAKRARQAEAVKVHYMLAGYYLDRVYGAPKADVASAATPPPNAL